LHGCTNGWFDSPEPAVLFDFGQLTLKEKLRETMISKYPDFMGIFDIIKNVNQ
jgi:hypothetical protein